VVSSVKRACISETGSDTAKVTILLVVTNSKLSTHNELLVGTMFDDLEWHFKVISAYVVIPTSSVSEIIDDTSTETEIANKKSHENFQAYIHCR